MIHIEEAWKSYMHISSTCRNVVISDIDCQAQGQSVLRCGLLEHESECVDLIHV